MTVSLDCQTGVVILGVIAGVYSFINLILIGCIFWCACCYGKRKFQVRPLSPKSGYKSSRDGGSYRGTDDTDMRYIPQRPLTAQMAARRLKTISESTSENDRVTVTSVTNKSSPFISRHTETIGSSLNKGLEEEKEVSSSDSGKGSLSGDHVDGHSCHGDSPSSHSNSGSAFANSSASDNETLDSKRLDYQSCSSHEDRKREAIIHRRRAKRTDSTKPLIGASESIGDLPSQFSTLPRATPQRDQTTPSHVTSPSEYDTLSRAAPPSHFNTLPRASHASQSSAAPMKVLTRHVGSRKRRVRTDSIKSLVEYMEEYERSTLPRRSRPPPVVSPHAAITQSLQTVSENTTTVHLEPASIERPRPRGQRSASPTPPLARLSLNLADDLGLDDKFTTTM